MATALAKHDFFRAATNSRTVTGEILTPYSILAKYIGSFNLVLTRRLCAAKNGSPLPMCYQPCQPHDYWHTGCGKEQRLPFATLLWNLSGSRSSSGNSVTDSTYMTLSETISD
jgi:hypothetical protein